MPDDLVPIILSGPSDSPRTLAGELSRQTGKPLDESLRILCLNNGLDPALRRCGGRPIWIQPNALDPAGLGHWSQERGTILRAFQPVRNARRVAQEEPWLLQPLAKFVETTDRNGWLTGQRFAELGGYGATGASAYSGVLSRELRGIAQLADEVYKDVMRQLAQSRAPFGVSRGQRPQLKALLKAHPRYAQLRRALDGLPKFVQRRLGDIQLPSGPQGNARFFRRQFVVPRGVRPGVYLSRITNRLGDQMLRSARYAKTFTWVVPAALGVYATATAPAGQRLRTGAGETGGVVFGAMGSAAGGAAVALGGSLLVAAGIVAVPGAIIFVTSVVAAGTAGYLGYSLGKTTGEALYDAIEEVVEGMADWFVSI